MSNFLAQFSSDLKPGQTWRVNNRYLRVSEVGKTLVHYRLLKRLDRKPVVVHVASKHELSAYLELFRAEEVCNSAAV
jgi:hypothetical protein